ncbi:hypothetical protein OEB99_02865 [Actinotalea sp. M2MS4P-6]|uniref:ABC transporter permease n=1 Tax=Actinotalea sp. M2MS4P-6 TaxID=2983762 RepID=UPI0021E43367|nr:hypothetical protein [Actinotalea sp. M2MS4P-6]MCV2393240.1 hypothetical protein [Actinotalea sp. M2MS4P-6]
MAATTMAGRRTQAPAATALARFTGTGPLVRLALRRDRVLAPVWIAVFAFSAAGSAAATIGIYPTEASRVQIADTLNSSASSAAFYGPILDPTSMGQVSLFKMYAFGAAMVGLLGLFLVARHTRGEEEDGRTELVGAGVVGRWAPLAAALTWTTIVLVVLGLVTAVSLVGAGLDVVGSLSFALAWLVTGLAFTAIGAVTAQVATTSRGAKGLAGGLLGLAYLIRAVADGSADGELVGLRWMSPVGWAQEVHAFADPRWSVGVLGLAFFLLVSAIAFALVDRRDLGAGLLPDRAGAASAPRSLSGGLGLAWRLHRGLLAGWVLGAALLSMVLGGLVANLGGFVDEGMQDMLAALGGQQGLEDTFVAVEWSFIGTFFGAYAIAALLRLRSEEATGRSENLLATPLTRPRWAASHLIASIGGVVTLLVVTGTLTGFSISRSLGDSAWWSKSASAAAVQLPAILVMVGLTILAIGLVPRFAVGLSWGLFVAFFLLGEIGALLELPQWVMDLSPFAHTPRLPGGDLNVPALVILTVLGLGLIGAGVAAYRRRDLEA